MVEPIERLMVNSIFIELIAFKFIIRLKLVYFAVAKVIIPKLFIKIILSSIKLILIEEVRLKQELILR
jgi:hypothetical protein